MITRKTPRGAELLETAELAAFVRTVETGSLSRAAKELGIPRATLGRRLARLEDQLGARLLRRTTRNVVLTDEGRVLYERGREALAAIREAAESVGRETGAIRGRLRVSMPPMPDGRIVTLVAEFLEAHPEVTLELTFSTATVSFGEDGYDVALRASTALDPSLVRRTIGQQRLVAVASPAYLAAHGTPKHAIDLERHACIRGFARGELPTSEWPTPTGTIRVNGPLATNEIVLQAAAAVRGLGIALVPEMLVAEPIERGALVRVLEGEVGVNTTIAVVYPERKLLRPVVRAFVEALMRYGLEELTRQPKCPPESPPTPAARKRARRSPTIAPIDLR
jgi:DNA-binding transcriptional LysR family regulator